jgi:tetratricopeptide (TPR) repeat protein
MRAALILLLALALSACALHGPLPSASAAGSVSGTAVPAGPQPPPVAPEHPAPPPGRPARMGPAASALLARARAQASAGEYVAAGATLERSLRIEPDTPLLWVELGRVQLAQGNAAQADAMGRKALVLASGDGEAQAAAWTLIADSLRARGRTAEAVEAQRRAAALTPH